MVLLRKNRYKNTNEVKSRSKYFTSARLTALFFFVLFSVSFMIQSAAVAALSLWSDKKPQPRALEVAQQSDIPASGALGEGTTLGGPEPGKPQKNQQRKEIVAKRTANTKTYDNGDGTGEIRNYHAFRTLTPNLHN